MATEQLFEGSESGQAAWEGAGESPRALRVIGSEGRRRKEEEEEERCDGGCSGGVGRGKKRKPCW